MECADSRDGDKVVCLSTSIGTTLIATATEHGNINVWDLSGGLFIMVSSGRGEGRGEGDRVGWGRGRGGWGWEIESEGSETYTYDCSLNSPQEHAKAGVTIELLNQCLDTAPTATEEEEEKEEEEEEGMKEVEVEVVREGGKLEMSERTSGQEDDDNPQVMGMEAEASRHSEEGSVTFEIEASSPVAEGSEPALKRQFHITALSVFAHVATHERSRPATTHPPSPALVSGVTVIRDNRATPLLLLHSIRSSQPKWKSKSGVKPPPPPPTLVSDDDPLLDWNLDMEIPPSILSTSFPPTSLPPPSAPDSLLDLSETAKSDSDPLPALMNFETAISLTAFSLECRTGCLPEVQHVVPMSGADLLAVSVTCRTLDGGTSELNSSKSLHGGLMIFTTTGDDSGCVSIDKKPSQELMFFSEGDTIVSMCELAGGVATAPLGDRGGALAVVNERGEVVVYDRGLEVVSRYVSDVGGDWRATSVTYCPPLAQLALTATTTSHGKVILLSLGRQEGRQQEVDGKSVVVVHFTHTHTAATEPLSSPQRSPIVLCPRSSSRSSPL